MSTNPTASGKISQLINDNLVNEYRFYNQKSYQEDIDNLIRAFNSKDLVLFLGAGVSIDAGAPSWKELISKLVPKMLEVELKTKIDQYHIDEISRIYKNFNNTSPISLVSHVKNSLGSEFRTEVCNLLYANVNLEKSEILKGISKLCRPTRDNSGVHSVVTYNFDDLLERVLYKKDIEYASIYKDEQVPKARELAIYHVHGFLPSDGSLNHDKEMDLVFTEDAYHSQFLDPYNWANITQLSLLREKTCLFIGSSVTDPNIRRLLDVAHRKNKEKYHYAIIKKHLADEVNTEEIKNMLGLSIDVPDEEVKTGLEAVLEIINKIEEDAYKPLGLKIIWINSFDEIPKILLSILG
ncbi:SIR2 family protein [Desulfolucanica intricata]|uniref:SIR2 family protein n=1 Tax=Desulfolucanica intricata TaxID=1285191 RepID=UPI0008340A60|nr:SIR2 family protein [Desulfolucanica intricata]